MTWLWEKVRRSLRNGRLRIQIRKLLKIRSSDRSLRFSNEDVEVNQKPVFIPQGKKFNIFAFGRKNAAAATTSFVRLVSCRSKMTKISATRRSNFEPFVRYADVDIVLKGKIMASRSRLLGESNARAAILRFCNIDYRPLLVV